MKKYVDCPIQVGDIVRCINTSQQFKDFGWVEGLEFEVIDIIQTTCTYIIFGGHVGAGVYLECLEKVSDKQLIFNYEN